MEKSTHVYFSIEQIRELLAASNMAALKKLLDSIHPADIADVLEELTTDEAVIAFSLLADYEASEVLDEANSSLTAELIEKVDDERLADLLEELPMDDAAELLEDLPQETSARLLALMKPEESREVRAILSYPEDSVGRLMTQDVAALRANWTVTQAIEYLRALDDTETFHYLYVVDVVGRLQGVVPIRNLVLAQPAELIENLSLEELIAVEANTDQEELAGLIARYDYTAMPVVDEEDILLGVVTIDDAVDVLTEETTEDIQQLGGSAPLEQPYFQVRPLTIVRKRIVWLLMLFFASMLSGSIVAIFNSRIDARIMATLTIFITLVIGTGGNAGSQTVATIIRALAVDEVRFSDLGRALRKELIVSLIMGIVLGLAGFMFATGYMMVQSNGSLVALGATPTRIALVIALTLPAVVMWSNTIATVIPIWAERLGRDPTVVSAPLITTVVDATGLVIYYLLAMLILQS